MLQSSRFTAVFIPKSTNGAGNRMIKKSMLRCNSDIFDSIKIPLPQTSATWPPPSPCSPSWRRSTTTWTSTTWPWSRSATPRRRRSTASTPRPQSSTSRTGSHPCAKVRGRLCFCSFCVRWARGKGVRGGNITPPDVQKSEQLIYYCSPVQLDGCRRLFYGAKLQKIGRLWRPNFRIFSFISPPPFGQNLSDPPPNCPPHAHLWL